MVMRPQYGEQHQRASAALIVEHVAEHGYWCPGLDGIVQAHPATDLVADHLVAGHPEMGYQALCRRCNTKRMALGLG